MARRIRDCVPTTARAPVARSALSHFNIAGDTEIGPDPIDSEIFASGRWTFTLKWPCSTLLTGVSTTLGLRLMSAEAVKINVRG